MKTTAQVIPFRNQELLLVNNSGEAFVPMKPVVEGMGLAWQSQHRKLMTGRFASTVTEMVIVAQDGKQREMTCLPLRKLTGWLMSIHPNKVRPELRDGIIAYQNECDDVLWSYWNDGIAVRHDDRNINTLLGQTIGTDGFRCLGAVLDGKVRSLPKPIRTKVKNHIWSQVHKAFSVVSAQDIPANSMDAARNFIAAYAIEGEWIAAAKDDARRNALTSEQLADIRHLLNASRGVKQLWDGGIGRLVAAANWNVYSNTYGHIEALDDIGRALSKSLGISISTDKVCSTGVVSRNADKHRDELIDYAKHFKSSCTLVEHGSFEPVRKGKLHEKIAAQKHRLLALAKSVSPTDKGYDAYLLLELKSLQELESRNKSHYLVGMGLWHMALRRYIEPVVPM
ncbi:hypothetical protein ABIE61_003591 [Marinobacterium sp. MBR-111]|jgi:hypothetical protein|uniref:phage antirepressor N-terminal domain-containing protein n=1 Tax=Marinobacterium sp. MBR-111 TaxID=3156463 RepID=UPI00339B16A4